MRRLVDSHVHLDGFTDIQSIVDESQSAGVDAVICVGGDIESSKKAIEAAASNPDFFYLYLSSDCLYNKEILSFQRYR